VSGALTNSVTQTVVHANKAVAAMNFMGLTQIPTSRKARTSLNEKR
jgi:hypothetical protein